MRLFFRYLFPLFSLPFLDGCIRTVPTPTPGNPCQQCTVGQVTFTPASPDRLGSIDATHTNPTIGGDGCLHMVAECIGDEGFTSFMQFNINQGGPVENNPAKRVVEAPLDCRNGQWFYMNRQVNEVNCQEAGNG
ncbi:unnamed protein product, partial [Mesorhabditis belari]|uniref:C6 domain-containing protein n=1 Tax=Mesorhabditis belari TaxID=2138241 RepID=A0AAF3EQ64_9BILA